MREEEAPLIAHALERNDGRSVWNGGAPPGFARASPRKKKKGSQVVAVLFCAFFLLLRAYAVLFAFVYSFLRNAPFEIQLVVGILLTYISVLPIFHYAIAVLRGCLKRRRHVSDRWTSLPPLPGEVTTIAIGDRRAVPVKHCNIGTCARCGRLRPMRTHHCNICDRCYVRFDHHCTWLAGCVALHNHAHFWLFLAWLTFTCVVHFALIFAGLVDGWLNSPEVSARVGAADLAVCLLALIASAVMAVMGAPLFFFHTRLLRTNQTTLEYHLNASTQQTRRARGLAENFVNPFDRGSVRANVAQVFGRAFAAKLLLPIPVRPPMDLFAWELVRQEIIERATSRAAAEAAHPARRHASLDYTDYYMSDQSTFTMIITESYESVRVLPFGLS